MSYMITLLDRLNHYLKSSTGLFSDQSTDLYIPMLGSATWTAGRLSRFDHAGLHTEYQPRNHTPRHCMWRSSRYQ